MSASTRVGLRGDDAQRLVAERLAVVGRGKVGAEVEEIVLDAAEHGVDLGMVAAVCSRARPMQALASSTVP